MIAKPTNNSHKNTRMTAINRNLGDKLVNSTLSDKFVVLRIET